MTELIAQLQVQPIEIGAWLMSAGAVLWIVNQAREFFGGAKRRKVEMEEKPVIAGSCKATHDSLDKSRNDYQTNHGEVHKKLDEAQTEQWGHINRHTEQIKELSVSTEKSLGELKQLVAATPRETADLIAKIRGL